MLEQHYFDRVGVCGAAYAEGLAVIGLDLGAVTGRNRDLCRWGVSIRRSSSAAALMTVTAQLSLAATK